MFCRTIYLIRHAQPDFPDGIKLCLGRKNDLPLSPAGVEQAGALSQYLRSRQIEAVYSSPLLRARQTAEIIAAGRPIRILHELTELDGGEWDGLPFPLLRKRYPQYFHPAARFSCPPGGETDESGLQRMQTALEYILSQKESTAALVAHGGVNRLLLCSILGMPLHEKRSLAQDYACCSILRYENGVWSAQDVGRIVDHRVPFSDKS